MRPNDLDTNQLIHQNVNDFYGTSVGERESKIRQLFYR